MNRLQEFSFALCFNYARATRSVSIPSPVFCEHFPSYSILHILYTYVEIPVIDADVRLNAFGSSVQLYFDTFYARRFALEPLSISMRMPILTFTFHQMERIAKLRSI